MNEKSSPEIMFYWDIGSTNSYFAFHLLRPLARRYGASIAYVPFNLGYVFRHHKYALTDEPRAKMKNRGVDLARWARKYELPFHVPAEFPIKTSRALRGALVMRVHDLEEAYMERIFAAYWEQGDAGIQDYPRLREIAADLGVDRTTFVDQAESPEVKQQLIDLTQNALAADIFGAPTMVIDDEIYWGKDRFDFVEDHLRQLTR